MMTDLKGVRRNLEKAKSLSAEELNVEKSYYMHFSVTKNTRFRCMICEDEIGFVTFKTLATFGRHFQRYHLSEFR